MTTDPAQAYGKRLGELGARSNELERSSRRMSTARGLSFLAVLATGAFGLAHSGGRGAWYGFAVAAVAFIGFVVAHASLLARVDDIDKRKRLVQAALDRLRGKLPPGPGLEASAPEIDRDRHAYAADLDLVGTGALRGLFDTTHTMPGRGTLARWVLGPASAREIAERQAAARDLAARERFREEVAVACAAAARARADGQAGGGRDGGEPLVAWAEATAPPVSLWAARVGAIAVALTLALALLPNVVADLPYAMRKAWLAPFVVQLVVLAMVRDAVDAIVASAASRAAPFGRYRSVFHLLEHEPFEAPRLVALRGALRGGAHGGSSASREMASLERMLSFADLRHSGIVHTIANLGLLWDVWVALALDRWRRRVARRVRGWVDALGEIEALASIGTFAFERPRYAWPDVVEAEPLFVAEGLGHPLVDDAHRVVNDVSLERSGTALMVTGSNMSGKSTLLRAIGVAAVFALAGLPVCARRLRVSTLAVRTSMRVSDSIEHGVSRFYAELQRLKAIVDAVDAGERVLFLLDEILHGTNSRERLIGAKGIVRHLVEMGAIGAVSSHDLGLSELEPETAGRVTNVHFEEQVEDGAKMTFDYRLKPGVVRSGNALRLMRSVGLAVDLPDASASSQKGPGG